jgi:tetratricopeptide (TPR) repeat protein
MDIRDAVFGALLPGEIIMEEEWHISAELFRRFLDLRVSKAERKAIVRHLITQCPECLGLVGRVSSETGFWLGPAAAEAFADQDYERAFDAAFQFADRNERRVALERLRGLGHWSALEPLLPSERLPFILEHRTWQHWGLFRALLDAYHRYVLRDPREAVNVVRLALDLVELLDPAAVGGEASANDQRARAWSLLGNARRLASDLAGARQALNEAWRFNEAGLGHLLDKAQIYSLDASYTRTIGEFETAESILERALTIYIGLNDFHLQGRTLLEMGNTVGFVNPERGITHIQHGLQLINPVREPRLMLCAQHGMVHFLADAGRPREALAILERIRPLYRQFTDDWTQLQLCWLQGRVARALDQTGEAIHILRHVWEEFQARDRHVDFLMVSIDLAEAHTAAGEIATAGRLLAEVTPLMESWNLHRNALAAWLMFRQALERRQAAGALFAQIRLYYRRHWHVPSAELNLE